MFDLSRDVILHNGFVINDASIREKIVPGHAIGSGISGCILDSIESTDVDVVQYTEKKALKDGMDVGDPFLGMRRVRAAGTLFAVTPALLYDALADLRAATSPVLAQLSSPLDHGYVPMYGSVPTNRVVEYPEGVIDLRVLAMPRGMQYTEQKDNLGGNNDTNALAIPFQAIWVMRDPRIYSELPVDVSFTPTTNATGTLTNRGNYPAPLNMLFQVTSAAGLITVVAGGTTFTVTVPASSGERIIRLKGDGPETTVEEAGEEGLALDYVDFPNNDVWAYIPGGDTPYSVTFSGGLALVDDPGPSHMWFWEAFA